MSQFFVEMAVLGLVNIEVAKWRPHNRFDWLVDKVGRVFVCVAVLVEIVNTVWSCC